FSGFSSGSFAELFKSFFYGLKFDAAAIVMTNCLFIFLSVLPFNSWNKRGYQWMLKTIFITVNTVCLLPGCVDFVFFRFIAKRTTAEIFSILSLGSDIQNTIPRMALDFWYVILIFLLLVFLMIRLYNHIHTRQTVISTGISVQSVSWLMVLLII